MARIPDKDEFQDLWSDLDTTDRRAIVRAVSRGEPVRQRSHARLAVVRARQQQTYWKYAWLAAPAVSLFALGSGWQVVLVQAVLLTSILGGFARWRYRRAVAAEEANVGRVEGTVRPPKAQKKTASSPGLWDRIHNALFARTPD